MKPEWPLGKAEGAARTVGLDGRAPFDDAEPLLPLPYPELVASIKASPAVDAFARKRAVQIAEHGHTPEADLEKPIGLIALEAKARLDALTEIVGGRGGRMNLPAAQRERCLRYVEIAGGILLSLWERCQVEVDDA